MMPPTATSPNTPAATTPAALVDSVRRPPRRAHRYEWLVLLALGLVTELAYLFGFVLPYPLAGHYATPLLDLNRLSEHTAASANYFAVTWAVSFVAMFIAYRRAPATPSRRYLGVLGAAALVFNLTLLLMYPTGAADLFDQIFRARELVVYGKNPFFYPPAAPIFAHDPFRPYVGGWAGTTSPYGPVWELLAAGTAWLAGNDLWRAVIFFKGLVILAYAGTACLIYATLRWLRPAWATRGLLFFAWNPLVLWETAGNGHNDMVMILFIILCCWLLARGGRAALLAPAALALAALAKFVPVLLLPIVLVVLWQDHQPAPDASRQAWLRALAPVAAAAAAFLIICALFYAPFWYGPDTIGALARRDLFTASIPNALKNTLASSLLLSETAAMDWVRNASTLVVVIWVLGATAWLVLRPPAATRAARVEAGFRAAYSIFFVYLVFGTLWFQPWYQSWLVALTPLTTRLRNAKRTLIMNAGGVGNYFVWDYLVLWNNSWGNVVQWTSALVVNLPVLLYTVYGWLVPTTPANAYRAGPEPPAREGTTDS
jgi:alpha-1,6-mannosyltransferase